MGSASGSLQSYTAVLNSAHEANQTLAVSLYCNYFHCIDVY